MMAHSDKPGGLSIGGRAWSKVLVTIHRKHLVGETGALTYLIDRYHRLLSQACHRYEAA